jgi:hypothetical protein
MTSDTVVFCHRMERDDILKEVIKASQEVDRIALTYGELYEFLGDRPDQISQTALASLGQRLRVAEEELDVLLSRLSDAHRAVVLARAEMPVEESANSTPPSVSQRTLSLAARLVASG